MFDILENILQQSGLAELFIAKVKEDNTNSENSFIAYRVKTNIYKIRSFELWGNKNDFYFRIYHSDKINVKLKEKLASLKEIINKTNWVVDYKSNDYAQLATMIKNILLNNEIVNECKNSSAVARTSKFEGLNLPDVDTSQNDVMGQTFTWREIISIWEDNSENNNLKRELSKNGIYIQRSRDGKSRYIGSACGIDGIIGRWMKHLNSNGDAQQLNLFVLENGYNEISFSVIEFYNDEDIIKRENMWKQILGTINYGPYNAIE
ncbi:MULTISPECIES: GIY-YIG nuclease family protein [Sporomusa]|uniref:GIY-YIG nuclease family protein n=1 Tax=Sporomusa TaxID=2375 RepID=UPI00166810A9|nr:MULTISPECIES: GIY-YIG nuclease family protein [Sporomusa]MCM0759094.1 GIY-YIG nuclease family protein [Sporomusa sphaeroides DSM 2875]